MKIAQWVTFGLIATLGMSASAEAEEARPYWGFQLMYTDYQGDLTGSGLGFGILGGYKSGGRLSIPLQLAYGPNSTYIVNPGLDYIFWKPGPIETYIHGGYGWYATEVKFSFGDVKMRGSGPDVGLGADLVQNPGATIGMGVVCRFVRYTQADDSRVQNDINGRQIDVYIRWKIFFDSRTRSSESGTTKSSE